MSESGGTTLASGKDMGARLEKISRRIVNTAFPGTAAEVVRLWEGPLRVQNARVVEVLNECLADERLAARLFVRARETGPGRELRESLERHVAQSRRHGELLEAAVRELDRGSRVVTETAALRARRSRFLLAVRAGNAELQLVSDLEGALDVLTREQVSLRFLEAVIPFLAETRASEALESMVYEVGDELDEQLSWLRVMLNRLKLLQALRPAEPRSI